MVSSDDDMRPYALMEHSLESLDDGEVSRGRLHRAGRERLHPQVVRHPRRRSSTCWASGPARSRTTTSKGEVLRRHRDGPGDQRDEGPGAGELADARARPGRRPTRWSRWPRRSAPGPTTSTRIDFADLFLEDEDQVDPDELNELYVLVNFRPAVTNKNWRMDCGVAGYDNTFGLPPFFPTRLRFEDYIYRLWIQQDGVAAAHVDAAQNHTRVQLHAEPGGRRDLQRGGVQPAQAEDQGLGHAGRRAGHRVRLRGRGDGRGRPGRSSTRWRRMYGRALEAAERRRPAGARGRPAALRGQPAEGVLRRSSRTSSSRTCCGSWTTW